MSAYSRIASALAANAFGQAVTVGSQLLLTPLYFQCWGAAKYGEWLILSSIPAYLTMADLGIGTAAGNEMTMRAGAGDRVGAQQTFFGSLGVAAVAAGVVCLAGAMFAAAAYGWRVPDTPSIARSEAALVLIGLALTVAFGFTGSVVSAGFRCCERNALGILLGNVARLAEVLLTGGLLLAGKGPAVVCLGLVLTKATLLVVQLIILRRVCPWLFTPKVPADRHVARRLMLPAIGFLAFPLGNALALQGPILIIGMVFGGPAVAMFSAMRTLARIPSQVTMVFNASVWPEMSRAHGAGQTAQLREFHRVSWGLTLILIVMMTSVLALSGRWIAHRWLGDATGFDLFEFMMLLALTCVSALWNASAVVMVAINAHLRLSAIYVATNGALLAIAATLAPHWGLPAMMSSLLATEIILLLWVMPTVLSLTADAPLAFLKNAPLAGVQLLISRVSRALPAPR